jgi:hypothetical protein
MHYCLTLALFWPLSLLRCVQFMLFMQHAKYSIHCCSSASEAACMFVLIWQCSLQQQPGCGTLV